MALSQKPSQSIQKSYLRQQVATADLEKFRSRLEILLKELNPSDTEEANKGRVKTFLEQTLWSSDKYEINASGKTDLTIKDKILNRNVVLFEFKKVDSTEMVTKNDLVKKAMFELVLYYILEEHEDKNTSIKHLVISDGYQYFIFEKGLFWELFGRDKKLVNSILSSEHTTGEKRDYIYNQIIKPKVEAIYGRLVFTHIDLHSFCKDISDNTIISKSCFRALYKLFSPTHLLNLSFTEDHNTLNKKFYTELLYIMGLEEHKDKQKFKIQRLIDNRQNYSLFEQAYAMLADYETNETADSETESKRFDIALGLVIAWINRVLFMKLLESQLVAFNGNDVSRYSFFDKLSDFAMMHYLFCRVMAIPEDERSAEMKEKFGDVPYLNSSLFELTEVEKTYFPISSLRDDDVEIMKGTCLKDKKGKTASGKIKILDYLKRFLNSYDFGDNSEESAKTIINASVLGLIFEKINGYKDGSFFTPGYVTSYLCHETLRRCVTDKYNERFGTSYQNFAELVDEFDHTNSEKRDEVNNLINSITVCDPAVGSGHFIVSALNEFIAIKRELNVLKTIDGKRFKFRVNIEDDELVVTDADGELHYNPNDAESQLVQETLFEEKRTIIENCLFGVDLNPNSAEICQLRLWIELLKHAYYIKGKDGKRHLQTLPNIDINIKCGNSLVMRYALDTSIVHILKASNITIAEYRQKVLDYKNSPSKKNRHDIEQVINEIKNKLDEGYNKDTSLFQQWVRVSSELLKRSNTLFPLDENETKAIKELVEKEAKYRKAINEESKLHSQLNAFEWRYEFPEVIDENGAFAGFDCIIGNPPYGVSIKDKYRKVVESQFGHLPDYEIYYYFVALGHKLLKNNGYLSYIIPNTWLFNVNAEGYRKSFFKQWKILELLDCTDFQIFESAMVRNTIVSLQKTEDEAQYSAYRSTRGLIDCFAGENNSGKNYFLELINRKQQSIDNKELVDDFSQNWGLALSLTDDEKRIVKIVCAAKNRLHEFFDVSQGYIPYRLSDLEKKYGKEEAKLIKEERRWHSNVKVDNSYVEEIKGTNINKYECTPSGVYVWYDKHVASYVDLKYFTSPRLLIREIVNPLIACYVEETYVNDPGIIDVINQLDDNPYSFKVLWGIMNSKLATFFLRCYAPKATKGTFPKVLIDDVKNFPLPELNGDNRNCFDEIERCYDQIFSDTGKPISNKEVIFQYESQIDSLVFKLYGINNQKDIDLICEEYNKLFVRQS